MKWLSRQNENGRAQEVPGTFVKVLMDPVSGKSASAKFYINTQKLIFCYGLPYRERDHNF